MCTDSKDIRVFLFELAGCLTEHDIAGIRYIEELPAEFERQSEPRVLALKVLLKLETEGKISAADLSNLTSLEQVFKNIKRLDLARRVKEFSKSASKSQKKCKRSSSKRPEEVELKLHVNLEVALVQMKLLLDQLKQVEKTAQRTAPNGVEESISEVREDAEVLERKLLHVSKELHVKDDRSFESSESDANFSPPVSAYRRRKSSFDLELEQKLLAVQPKGKKTPPRTRRIPKDLETLAPKEAPILPPNRTGEVKQRPQEESDEDLYAEVSLLRIKPTEDTLYCKFESLPKVQKNGGENSTLVTGALNKTAAQGRKKPVPPPKPANLQQANCVNEPDDDYTSSYTGTTGDSGFGDATQFLKIPLEPPQYSSTTDPSLSSLADTLAPDSPSYYKAIHKEEVGDPSYYKFVSKESQARKWQVRRSKDEKIYENYTSHNNTL